MTLYKLKQLMFDEGYRQGIKNIIIIGVLQLD